MGQLIAKKRKNSVHKKGDSGNSTIKEIAAGNSRGVRKKSREKLRNSRANFVSFAFPLECS